MTGLAAQAVTRYVGTYHGQPDQVRRLRAVVARHLEDCPVKDDALLIVSEICTNAVLHSESAGEFFTVRCELFPGHIWIECEDLGGPWHFGQPDARPHGLDIVEALAGPDNCGAEVTRDGDRVVWVRLDYTPTARPLP